MAKSKEMSMEEFFQDTFSEEFLREAEVEYTLAQIAGRAFDAIEIDPYPEMFKIKYFRHKREAKLYAMRHLEPEMMELKPGADGDRIDVTPIPIESPDKT